MLLRRIPFFDSAVRDGTWHWSAASGVQRLRDSVWGFIGFGRIAQNIARKIRVLGFEIRAFDPYISKGYMETMGVVKADLVDVMAPHTPETEGMLGKEELRKMKPTSVVVNCARGKIIRNDALVEALS